MPYIGPPAPNRFVAPKAASVFSGDGSTTAFTLDHAVGSDEDILVSVDGVIQEPSVAYAVSNGTTLTSISCTEPIVLPSAKVVSEPSPLNLTTAGGAWKLAGTLLPMYAILCYLHDT